MNFIEKHILTIKFFHVSNFLSILFDQQYQLPNLSNLQMQVALKLFGVFMILVKGPRNLFNSTSDIF